MSELLKPIEITILGLFSISALVIAYKSALKARAENTKMKQQTKTIEATTKQETARHQILVNALNDNKHTQSIRICGQCTHFNGNYQLPRCTRVQVLNLVDGRNMDADCHPERNKGTQCGPDGKLFNLKRSAA